MTTRRQAVLAIASLSPLDTFSIVPIPNAVADTNKYVRIATVETIQPDITALGLAQLLGLEVTWTDSALDALTPEKRALVERNSRPL